MRVTREPTNIRVMRDPSFAPCQASTAVVRLDGMDGEFSVPCSLEAGHDRHHEFHVVWE